MIYTKLSNQQKKEAEALYLHLLNHKEVQGAPKFTGEPICKICNRTAKDILNDGEE
jgi:hypothetical protein